MAKVNWKMKYKIGINFIFIIRLLVFVSGIFILALGISTAIKANLGVPTWDVLHIGLNNLINLSIGRWIQILGVTMVLMTAYLEKKKPTIGSVLNIILVGFFVNTILNLNLIPSFTGLIPRSVLLLLGTILMGVGSGMYVSSKVGSGPRDGMTLFLSKRFSISVRLSRTLLEIAALTIGWAIGGPVSLGTFITVLLIGPVMQTSLKFCTSQFARV